MYNVFLVTVVHSRYYLEGREEKNSYWWPQSPLSLSNPMNFLTTETQGPRPPLGTRPRCWGLTLRFNHSGQCHRTHRDPQDTQRPASPLRHPDILRLLDTLPAGAPDPGHHNGSPPDFPIWKHTHTRRETLGPNAPIHLYSPIRMSGRPWTNTLAQIPAPIRPSHPLARHLGPPHTYPLSTELYPTCLGSHTPTAPTPQPHCSPHTLRDPGTCQPHSSCTPRPPSHPHVGHLHTCTTVSSHLGDCPLSDTRTYAPRPDPPTPPCRQP